MSDARRGYSSSLCRIVRNGDPESVVTKFALYCIEQEIPATEVAEAFKVTKATVYYWFKGVYSPRERHLAAMQKILQAASTRSA